MHFLSRAYSLPGAYRKIIIKPIDLKWNLMKYNDDTDNLIQSDMNAIHNDKIPESDPNGEFKALILEFSLPSSTYATMALREILKCDTSVASQVNLHETVTQKRAHDANEGDAVDSKVLKLENESET